MTCSTLLHAIATYPDWLTALGILFAAAVFGACVCWLVFEWRYAAGIQYQRRIWEREKMFRQSQ